MSATLEKPGTVAAPAPPATSPKPTVANTAPPRRRSVRRWLLQDSPYIIMLVLTLLGVTLRMRHDYWLVLIPLFGVLCILAGWRHFATVAARLGLVVSMVLSWGALTFAIYVLYRNGAQGVMTPSANEIVMLTLLGLGTFMAGVQSRVWRICVIGLLLFLAVPGMGWLEQSAVLLIAATVVIIAVSGIVWWMEQRPRKAMA